MKVVGSHGKWDDPSSISPPPAFATIRVRHWQLVAPHALAVALVRHRRQGQSRPGLPGAC